MASQGCFAQESVTHASVSGRVMDATGGFVQGASVTLRQSETNVVSSGETDREGRFRFPYLRVGPYEMKVHREGFADFTRNLTLTVGAAFELPVSLAVAAAEQSVTVSAEGTVLEAARTQIAGTVSQ
ncbi:MAG: carboxypeptidase-like regulatory domain-containing protein, partial [Acidobacteriota bacterium]